MEALKVRESRPGGLRRLPVLLLACTAFGFIGAVTVGAFRTKAVGPIPSIVAQAEAVESASKGTDWKSLSDVQRMRLHPIEAMWPKLDEPNRRRWLEVALRMQRLSPDAASRVRLRMAEWAKLSPQGRSEARLRYVAARRQLAGNGNEQWKRYQQVPRSVAAQRRPDHHLSMVAPAVANATPGATTVLLNQLQDAKLIRRPSEAAPG